MLADIKHCPSELLTQNPFVPRSSASLAAENNTALCSEIGSLVSLDAPEFHASSDVREPISLHQGVYLQYNQIEPRKSEKDGLVWKIPHTSQSRLLV